MQTIIVKTNGGMTLRAPVGAVVAGPSGMWAQWDMRHNLIRNPVFPYEVKSGDVRSIEYV